MSVTRIDKVIKTVPLLCHFYYHRKGMKARHQVISMNQEILAEGEASVRLTSLLRPAAFDTETTFSFLFTKQPILMRISTVLSLPLQLVFPALTVEKCFFFSQFLLRYFCRTKQTLDLVNKFSSGCPIFNLI
jgi:hypothetical protein